ncbi:hypothetical protein LAZ67_3001405 [Cordylochernes scorpioides]|uniref:DUF5641 domain-containing protein n=1 Tax=Cordylochernes scorpioides TaxID=51811 RepID=A0ABY6K9X6_9ARAC|nr:hypothetical protein LAZ67_3001405 [Cordylochernes scorpioides]
MGRVVETHPGKDGLVRVVSLRTSVGVLRRPLVKLVLLPVAPPELDVAHQLGEKCLVLEEVGGSFISVVGDHFFRASTIITPDLQGWVFGRGLEDILANLESTKTYLYKYYINCYVLDEPVKVDRITEDSNMQRMTEVEDEYVADALTNMQPHCEDLVGRLTDAIRGLAVPRAEEALISSFDGSHATSSLLSYNHLQRSTPASISHFKVPAPAERLATDKKPGESSFTKTFEVM